MNWDVYCYIFFNFSESKFYFQLNLTVCKFSFTLNKDCKFNYFNLQFVSLILFIFQSVGPFNLNPGCKTNFTSNFQEVSLLSLNYKGCK